MSKRLSCWNKRVICIRRSTESKAVLAKLQKQLVSNHLRFKKLAPELL